MHLNQQRSRQSIKKVMEMKTMVIILKNQFLKLILRKVIINQFQSFIIIFCRLKIKIKNELKNMNPV